MVRREKNWSLVSLLWSAVSFTSKNAAKSITCTERARYHVVAEMVLLFQLCLVGMPICLCWSEGEFDEKTHARARAVSQLRESA